MKWTVLFLFVVAGCSPGREMVMPYKNLGYSADRLFPVKTSYAEFSLRIWISNSTSVDRVISISKDSSEDFQGYIIEIGELYIGKKTKQYYLQKQIIPTSGFSEFKKKIDTLNLLSMTTQSKLLDLPFDRAFSTYVVEIKEKQQFNSFQFDTFYPYMGTINEKYEAIEKLVFEEFSIKEYFKFRK